MAPRTATHPSVAADLKWMDSGERPYTTSCGLHHVHFSSCLLPAEAAGTYVVRIVQAVKMALVPLCSWPIINF